MNHEPLSSLSRRYDAIVVGARCAGAATALLLARSGMRVLVLDKGTYGSDTLSTHALMRGGVAQLHRWGLLDAIVRAGTPPIRRTSFHYDDGVVDVDIRARGGVDALYAPRRSLLDSILVDAASAAGAVVRHGATVTGVLERNGRVMGVVAADREGHALELESDLVIGADGVRSRIAGLVGAELRATGRHASALVYGYFEGMEGDAYHWHWRAGVSAGVIPTNEGLANVFVATTPERLGRERERGAGSAFARLLAEAAPGVDALATAERRRGPLRMFLGERGWLRAAYGPGWALVGDAGVFRDPLIAHGISDALRDAELLARAAVRGSLGDYEAERDAIARGMLEVGDAVASFAWDTARIHELHARLQSEMKTGLRAIEQLDRLAA